MPNGKRCITNSRRYHSTHGNANVPDRFMDNPKLSMWVNAQRARYKKRGNAR
ncbi:MAG: helicase associated domain-containing protein [Nitrosomonas sp.]|nr:helicase associated domain-containing protein [Nitrosomonas sp.]